MSEQPNTAAGRALLRDAYEVLAERGDLEAFRIIGFDSFIHAIEAEARQQDGSALRETLFWLQMALDWEVFKRVPGLYSSGEMIDIRARIDSALAALPPSAPPALDVERLAWAFFNARQAGDNDTGWDDLTTEWQQDEIDHTRRALAEYARLQEQER